MHSKTQIYSYAERKFIITILKQLWKKYSIEYSTRVKQI